MKRTILIILGSLVGLLAIVAIYRFCLRKSIPDAPVSVQVQSIMKQNGCFVCHSKNPDLPFYSSLPHVSKAFSKECEHAVSFTDLSVVLSDPDMIDEVTLSMIEHAVTYSTMPTTSYRLIHWGTGFNSKEKSILSAWIMSTRGKLYPSIACAELANEPIRPLPDSIPYDAAKAELGERMFNDTRISLDGTISCASCHILEENGADELDERTSGGINGLFGTVNAHTVYNSYFNVRQFWNGRAADLQEQAAAPPVNPVEMGEQSWDDIIKRLGKDMKLVKEFQTLYHGEGLTQNTVTDVIAEFEKTLITPNCRFDRYLKGDTDAITNEELAGYETFKKNACATCHTGIILGGQSFEKIGIYGNYYAERTQEIEYNSDDDGLKSFTGNDSDLHKFKVPGLRNICLTPPYFHDGSYNTLEDAVKAMAKYELGKELSDKDVKSILLFMNTLTGEHRLLNI